MAVVNNQSVPFYQAIHAKKRFRLGTEKSDVAGNAYRYTQGVASLVAGDFVAFAGDGSLIRTLAATTGPVGVAMSANTAATTFGWVLVSGKFATANVTTHASGAGKALFTTATAGRTIITPTTEQTMYGAFSDGNAVANVGAVLLNRANAPGDIST